MGIFERIMWLAMAVYFLVAGYGALHVSPYDAILPGVCSLVGVYLAMRGLKRPPV